MSDVWFYYQNSSVISLVEEDAVKTVQIRKYPSGSIKLRFNVEEVGMDAEGEELKERGPNKSQYNKTRPENNF